MDNVFSEIGSAISGNGEGFSHLLKRGLDARVVGDIAVHATLALVRGGTTWSIRKPGQCDGIHYRAPYGSCIARSEKHVEHRSPITDKSRPAPTLL